MANTDFYNSLLTGDISTAADLNIAEKAVYGVGSALISGGLSLVNSTTSLLSRPFSDSPDEYNIDKADAVDSILGSDASRYYRENQTVLDVAGELGATFIPGTLAIKGLRALQGSKLLLGGYDAAKAAINTGSVTADLGWGTFLRPTAYAESLTARAVSTARKLTDEGGWTIVNAAKNKAIAAYAYQGALEGIAFEFAAETFLNQSTLYDKDSLAQTMLWNPLLSGSLGGLAGSLVGRFNVFAKGGLQAAKNDIARAMDVATLGIDLTSRGRFAAEDVGILVKRGELQQQALQAEITSGRLTEAQIETFTSVQTRVKNQTDNLVQDAMRGAIPQGSNLRPQDLLNVTAGKSAEEIQGILTGVRTLTNVNERDMLYALDSGIQDVLYLNKSNVARASAEFNPAATAQSLELGDEVTKAVVIRPGTKIYTEAEAVEAAATGVKVGVVRRADGSYVFPNGLGAPGLQTANAAKETRVAKNGIFTVEELGTEASVTVVLKSSDLSMVSDNIYPRISELVGPKALKEGGRLVTPGGKVLDVSVPTFGHIKNPEAGLESLISRGAIDYQTAEAEWIRASKFVAGRGPDQVADSVGLQASLPYAEAVLVEARRSGVAEIRVTGPAGTKTTTFKSVESLEREITLRKANLLEDLKASGASLEEIESFLHIKLNANGTENLEKFVGMPIEEIYNARYVKAQVNVAKADAMLNGVMTSKRLLEESRGYQMLGQPLALETAQRVFGLSPDKFVRALELNAMQQPVMSPGGGHATIVTNARVTATVYGAGQQAIMVESAASKLGKDRYGLAIAPTAKFLAKPEAVNELAVVRTLYSQRAAGGDLYIMDTRGATYLVNERAQKELAEIAVRLERAQTGNPALASVQNRVAAAEQAMDSVIQKYKPFQVRTSEAADHLKAMAAENHAVESARRPVSSFLGKETLNTQPNKVWFPSPDPLDEPFLLIVRMPGVDGANGGMKMFLADKATFESKRAGLIARTQLADDEFKGAQVLTTSDIKRYKTTQGEFEYSKDFLQSQFDNEVAKQGKILAQGGFDQKYFLGVEQSLIGRYKQLGLDTLHTMYPEYSLLQKLHVEAAKNKLSTLGKPKGLSSVFDIDRQTIGETQTDYSTILDVMSNTSRENRTQLPGLVNRFTQAAFDRSVDAIRSALGKEASDPNFVKNILTNTQLDEVSQAAYAAGANVHAAQMIVANTKASGSFNPNLSSVISKVNALSNFFTMRLDAMYSIMNAVSTPITALPHFRQILNEVKAGNGGALTPQLEAMLGLKAGAEYSTLTGAKLYAAKAREFFAEPEKVKAFLTDVLKVDITNYQHSVAMVDLQAAAFAPDITLAGYQKTIKSMAGYIKENRISKGLESFADHTEAFNQYVTGRAGYEIALAAGKSEATARLFSAGFAQQVNNAINSGARHSFYSGPMGMMMGLYQNYTRGMITRTLQFVDEGNLKSALELAGLQGAIFGARGLPLFDFYNRKLLGENNKQHADAFSAIYGVNGQLLGDFIAYGAGSSLIGVNMFTRGDLTPFTPTILPAPWDSPAAKTLLAALKLGAKGAESFGQVLGGDPTLAKNNLIQAVEHNNINRPIGRMAAMLAGHSTTLDGKPLYNIWQPESRGVIGGLELPKELSYLVTAASGFSGTSALSEAITKDVMYRMTAYQIKDKEARNNFSKNLRTEMASGELTPERQADLSADYIRAGGTPQGFSQIHTKAAALGKSDPIVDIIKRDPGNNIYKYASIILGPQARMNPSADGPVD